MHAGLEYPDGGNANADSGLWLHHTVLTNANKKDLRGCAKGKNGGWGERWFASGNERTVIDLCASG
jgi:hypothetical protein